jgi:hypothetical protein
MSEVARQVDVAEAAQPKRDKRKKFVEIAEKRTINAIKTIRVIGKLGNKAHYEYDETDIRKIVSALNKEIETLRNRLSQTKGKEEIDFRLEP